MASFDVAVGTLLEKEGGYVDHPDDPGRETNFGISTRRYPELDIAALTREGAIALYQRDFWNPLYDRLEAQVLGTKLLEMTVHLPHGDSRPYYETDMKGIRLLQRALHQLGHTVEVDGRFGPQTLMAVRLMHPGALLEAIKVQQAKYYVALVDANTTLRPFLLGWIRRAVAALGLCLLPLPLSSAQDLGTMPICRGGEIGFWQPLIDTERKKVGIVLTRIDALLPGTVLCQVDPTQRLQALPLEVQL